MPTETIQYHGGPLPHDQNLQISRHHFQKPDKPWVVSCKPFSHNPGTTKSRLRQFTDAKVQTQKNIKQNYNFLPFTFSTLHLCTLQIFTIYFGCSESVDCENSHDLPSPLPLKTMRVLYHVARLLNFAIGRPTLSGGGAGEGARAVAQHLLPSSLAIDVYMNLPALSLEHGWLAQ